MARLGEDHAVVFAEGDLKVERPDGRRLRPGQFPCWTVAGKGRTASFAVMLNIGEFRG